MDHLYAKIQNHCLENPAIESCGLIIETPNGIIAEPCKNISNFPKHHFLISSEEQREKEYKGKLLGFYHSHVDESDFSYLDKSVSEKTNLECFLYQIPTGKLLSYKPNGWRAPYLGRPFVPGIFDCYQLVKDYYKTELNVELPDLDHPFRFAPTQDAEELPKVGYSKKSTFLVDYFLSNGFQKVDDIQLNDILLIKTDRIDAAAHCLIYYGNDKILHHPGDKLSRIEQYNYFYQKRVVAKLRHCSQV